MADHTRLDIAQMLVTRTADLRDAAALDRQADDLVNTAIKAGDSSDAPRRQAAALRAQASKLRGR